MSPRTLIVSEPELEGVQRWATPDEQARIDQYLADYRARFGHDAEGLHCLPGLGGVWLPVDVPEEGSHERQ